MTEDAFQEAVRNLRNHEDRLERAGDYWSDEACESLKIGYNALYELLASGALKGYRNGRTWRIPKLAVQEYILGQAQIRPSKG